MSKVRQCKCCGFMADSSLIEEGLCPFCVTKRGVKDIALLWGVIAVSLLLWVCVLYLAAKLGNFLGGLL